MPGLRIRQAVRALYVTPSADVLLVRFEFPTRTVWALPGGGLEPDEDLLTALRRELHEELGVTDADIGPQVWTREHIIPHADGRWDGQRDHVFVVPIAERFEPRPALSWEQLRAERVHEIRWWTLAEVEAAQIHFAPGRMAELLRSLIADGPPPTPIDTGV